ncbi:hypothetical protein DFA_06597 [Cavenderia fasciculata]|uniref:Uncharacterized protein n=1 Tax=Cavenderia fasciculata TaxID=261658 RepID=F4PJG1_CACFS|nr:uncharacterized protein DFA_06597 [Cavenderia fasciculata]EGG24447.1 hypothetical protein DFA_06597 [Cavenderia fasciculata]|eukprot:XP_004362298.1 hypothetical protein DFA_06597 [Cavenderia fasciculata]
MTLGKSFQTLTVFVIIPLMLAVHANKLTLSAALDIIVWYIAVSFGIFIFKTPIKLYLIVREKSRLLNDKKDTYTSRDQQDIVRKHLLNHFNTRIDDIYYSPPPPQSNRQEPVLNSDDQFQQQQQQHGYEQILKQVTGMYTDEKIKSIIQDQLKLVLESMHQQQMISLAKQHQIEMKKIKKELSEWSNRRNIELTSIELKVNSMESRLLSLENQLELRELHQTAVIPSSSSFSSLNTKNNNNVDDKGSLISSLLHFPTRIMFGTIEE